jgi:ribose transport system permease protein
VLIVILLVWLVIGATGSLSAFAGEYNRDNLARSLGLQVFAIGELLVILTGGIDLSVGSLIAFDGMLLAAVMTRLADSGMPVGQATVLGVLSVLVFSLVVGTLHAVLVHFLRLPPFVVTLGSMSVLRSGARLLNNAVQIPIERFGSIIFLGNGKLYVAGSALGLPVPMVILLVIGAGIMAVLGLTRVGRHVYSVGSNEEASRLSGVDVFRTRLFVYGMCSLLTGIAAVLNAGYASQGDPDAGLMFELNAISAAVIGGAALTGGRGNVIGTVLGVVLLESILSMINLKLTSPHLWRGLVVGGVLLAAVIFNQVRQRVRIDRSPKE